MTPFALHPGTLWAPQLIRRWWEI